MTSRHEQTSVAIPILLTVIVHGALAGGLEAAHHYSAQAKDDSVMTVQFDVAPKTTPQAPPAAPPPPPEVIPPPKVAALRTRPIAKASAPEPMPSLPPPQAPEPPAPGAPDPADEVPAPEYTYRLDAPIASGGTMAVAGGGPPTGSLYGRKDGSGKGKGGGGGPADSQGTGRMASAASIAKLPLPLEDYSDDDWEDYPEEALRLGIEGPVVVKVFVDEHGRVSKVTLIKGPGYGLNEAAVARSRHMRFKPAELKDGTKVAYPIVYTWNCAVPR